MGTEKTIPSSAAIAMYQKTMTDRDFLHATSLRHSDLTYRICQDSRCVATRELARRSANISRVSAGGDLGRGVSCNAVNVKLVCEHTREYEDPRRVFQAGERSSRSLEKYVDSALCHVLWYAPPASSREERILIKL